MLVYSVIITAYNPAHLVSWLNYFCGIHHYHDHKSMFFVKEALADIKGNFFDGRRLINLTK